MTNLDKKTLIEAVHVKTGLTKFDTRMTINAIIGTVLDTLAEGGNVSVRGFGSLGSNYRGPREAMNLHTKELHTVPECYVLSFKASKNLKDAANKQID